MLLSGRPLNRAAKSEGVRRLEEEDPWDGFSKDLAEWSERSLVDPWEDGEDGEDESGGAKLGSVGGVGSVDSVDSVDDVDSVDTVNTYDAVETINTVDSDVSINGDNKVDNKGDNKGDNRGGLTKEEAEKTSGFKRAHPNLMGPLGREEEWSEDRIVEWVSSNVKVDPKRVGDLYGEAEESAYKEPLLPRALVPSTTLAGVSYPLAGPLELGKSRLASTPTRYLGLVSVLNRECTPIIEACYQLYRAFRPGESQYFRRKCPVQDLFATSYTETAGYPRLTPRNAQGSATLANLRRDLKRVIRQVIDLLILPEGLVLEEVDMVACHTGIYAGLMGPARAPNTRQAYGSGAFWTFIFDKWGGMFDCPKSLLKRILYSGLNGASLTSRQGAICACVKEAYGSGDEMGFDLYLKLRPPSHPAKPLLRQTGGGV